MVANSPSITGGKGTQVCGPGDVLSAAIWADSLCWNSADSLDRTSWGPVHCAEECTHCSRVISQNQSRDPAYHLIGQSFYTQEGDAGEVQ